MPRLVIDVLMSSLDQRLSGVLLHPTSLPGKHGSGDLGAEAHAFVDWLADAKQSHWQMLPVVPTASGDSPYQSPSAFAGNPLLVSLESLVTAGLLAQGDLDGAIVDDGRVDFATVRTFRVDRLRRAFDRFRAGGRDQSAFLAYLDREKGWLRDYALFTALKEAHGGAAWTDWPAELRERRPDALAAAEEKLADEVRFHEFVQFLFHDQWEALHAHARSRGVALMGDLPIFVAHDSADVWANRHLFHLDETGRPQVVAGVPPDYFSETGQRWGNVLYDWEKHRRDDYAWWGSRFGAALGRFDSIRVDHFIGFHRFWAIPDDAPSAVSGKYMAGPGADLFEAMKRRLGDMPIVAEDLGVVTEEVTRLRERFGFPGMRVLHFSFTTDKSARHILPYTIVPRTVVYTGTHDNDTTVGWWHDLTTRAEKDERARAEREMILRYLGSDGREVHWDLLRLAWSSPARTAIAPVQDLLGLPSDSRMNVPGKSEGNWAFRLREGQLTPEIQRRLRELTETFARDV